MLMVTTDRRYTLADLAAMPDDEIFDILGGELAVRNVPDDNHAELLTALFGLLYAAQEAGFGRVYTSTRAVALDYPERGEAAEYVTHPDLFFIRPERDWLRGRRALKGVPDLIVEILSASTRDEHAPGGGLYDAYAQHGVPHYLVADPAARELRIYTLIGTPYRAGRYGEPTVLRPGDVLTSPLFPGVTKRVEDLFARVRDEPPSPRSSS
jgi:Uma2 family endonuclease